MTTQQAISLAVVAFIAGGSLGMLVMLRLLSESNPAALASRATEHHLRIRIGILRGALGALNFRLRAEHPDGWVYLAGIASSALSDDKLAAAKWANAAPEKAGGT